jgi:hypothetical protein
MMLTTSDQTKLTQSRVHKMTSCFLIDPLAFWGKRFLISGIWMRKN